LLASHRDDSEALIGKLATFDAMARDILSLLSGEPGPQAEADRLADTTLGLEDPSDAENVAAVGAADALGEAGPVLNDNLASASMMATALVDETEPSDNTVQGSDQDYVVLDDTPEVACARSNEPLAVSPEHEAVAAVVSEVVMAQTEIATEAELPPPVPEPSPIDVSSQDSLSAVSTDEALTEALVDDAAAGPPGAAEHPAEIIPLPPETPSPSLGHAVIDNGIVAHPQTTRVDPLAVISRMSQAEKVALFT
jgi:hypothetical protein